MEIGFTLHPEQKVLGADFQMLEDEEALNRRVAQVLESPGCTSGAMLCTKEAVEKKVIGEWAEEALQQDNNPLSCTLKEIVARTAPDPKHTKYHNVYLMR